MGTNRHARLQRDAALQRVGTITRTIAVASIAAAAAIGVYVSRAVPGHTSISSTSGTAPSGPAAGAAGAAGANSPGGPIEQQPLAAQQPTGADPATGSRGQRFDLSGPTVDADRPAVPGVYRSSVWSTRVDLVVTDPGVIVQAALLLRQTLERVDGVASRFRPDSEINELHRATDGSTPVVVGAELFEAIDVALRAARLTDGAVDPTVGSAMCRLGYDRDFSLLASDVAGTFPESAPAPGWRSVVLDPKRSTVVLRPGTVLDLGATAKAWASDRAAHLIASRLGCGALVSLGGDITVAGPAPQGGFAVGIADICGDPSAPTTVAIESGGLATSGIGNRHWSLSGHPVHHLLDPATGLPVLTPWRTVSVTAGTCVDANTASTAAMVMGEAALSWLAEAGLPSRLVRRDGATVAVAGWPDEADQAQPHPATSGSRTAVAP